MNGRVYDPVLARFLSADPFVGDASDSESYNRYSYVNNNPVNAIDPSGYFLKKLFKVVAVVAIAYFTAGWGAKFLGPLFEGALFGTKVAGGIGGGMAAGFSSAFAGSILNGANIGDAFKAGLVGGLAGAVTGGFLGKIGASDMNWFDRGMSHGLVHGGVAEATGGEFRHGFYAGFAVGATEVGIGNWADGNAGRGPSRGGQAEYRCILGTRGYRALRCQRTAL